MPNDNIKDRSQLDADEWDAWCHVRYSLLLGRATEDQLTAAAQHPTDPCAYACLELERRASL